MLMDPIDLLWALALVAVVSAFFAFGVGWSRGFSAASKISQRQIRELEQPRDERGRYLKR